MENARFSLDLNALEKVALDAQREIEANLADIGRKRSQIRQLEERNASLGQLVQGINGVLPRQQTMLPPNPSSDPDGAEIDVDPQVDPMWRGAFAVLKKHGSPMTAPELTKGLVAMGWPVRLDRAGIETVRTCVIQKSEAFRRVGRGYYGLREWPAPREVEAA